MNGLQPASISQAPVLCQLHGDFSHRFIEAMEVLLSTFEAECSLRAELLLAAGDIAGTGERSGQSIKVPVIAHQRRLYLPSGDPLPVDHAALVHFQLPSVVRQAQFIHDPWIFCLILILPLPSHLILDKLAILILLLREVYQRRA